MRRGTPNTGTLAAPGVSITCTQGLGSGPSCTAVPQGTMVGQRFSFQMARDDTSNIGGCSNSAITNSMNILST